VFVGIPILLIALAITVVGIPLSMIGGLVFALLLWIGIIYGRFAVAAWLLSLVGLGNRWLALVVGLLAGALLSRLPVPVVGEVISLVVLLLGVGAIARALFSNRRHAREREQRVSSGPNEPTTD
jgi:hypothetical protein